MAVVLVIADHGSAAVCRAAVAEAGHEVVEAPDARRAMRGLFEHRPSAVLLDAGLSAPPGGLGLLERMRQVSDVPVLLVGELPLEDDRVEALRLGADGYLLHPFGRRELAAWVDALVRRQGAAAGVRSGELGTHEVRIDLVARRVTAFGREVHLSPPELRVLTALAREPGTSLGAERLSRAAWPDGDSEPGLLQVVVSRLQQKLGADPHTGEGPVESVPGFGYRLRADGPAVTRIAARARRARRPHVPEARPALR